VFPFVSIGVDGRAKPAGIICIRGNWADASGVENDISAGGLPTGISLNGSAGLRADRRPGISAFEHAGKHPARRRFVVNDQDLRPQLSSNRRSRATS
jgi:hypothetical protein